MPTWPGQIVTLAIEKPAAGGRMIARLDGQVVLVGGAIPGERVSACIERVGKGLAYAHAVSVGHTSPDRREPFTDPLCGGCLYAHIAYSRQIALKGEVIRDAFVRIGRITLPSVVAVAPSASEGYRMRARLHVRGARVGFFRGGTHEVCDARPTRQLLPTTCDVIDRLAAGLRSLGVDSVRELDVSENVGGSERVVHLEIAAPVDPRPLIAVASVDGLTGLTISRRQSRPLSVAQDLSPSGVAQDVGPVHIVSGDPHVTDVLSIGDHTITLRRHVLAFFQGNRFLLRDLVAHVIGQIEQGTRVVDLYAGVGLFSVAAAVVRGAQVKAVEGNRVAAQDLVANAKAANASIELIQEPVEAFMRKSQSAPDTLIVDPSRTGMSREALHGAIALGARKIVYVSCDVATLARDARRLLDAGYTIKSVEAFDLFPNTPHVETVVVFNQ